MIFLIFNNVHSYISVQKEAHKSFFKHAMKLGILLLNLALPASVYVQN
jgi:predicted RNA polymerase sigma factor